MEKHELPGYHPQYERIAELIVEFIATQQLHPGDRLPTEQEFAERFGVSRTIVRDAIKMLTPSGLVRSRRGSGIFVGEQEQQTSPILRLHLSSHAMPERMGDLFEFRCSQEMQTARLAAQHITVAELRTIEHFLSINKEAAKSEDRETFLKSDDEFHRSIAIASHNVFFVETVTSILQLQRWAVNILTGGAPGSSWLAVEQHTRMFEAIRDGKPDPAAEAARIHVETVFAAYQREVRRRLMGSEDLQS
ncbi:MAG TPA: FadR/GntR family transcriptional regulator [Ktedonobacteraceae bacterium]|nr:FadR/GntR family transcriptional regulator [Ktedonobacteraceae bacterium]